MFPAGFLQESGVCVPYFSRLRRIFWIARSPNCSISLIVLMCRPSFSSRVTHSLVGMGSGGGMVASVGHKTSWEVYDGRYFTPAKTISFLLLEPFAIRYHGSIDTSYDDDRPGDEP